MKKKILLGVLAITVVISAIAGLFVYQNINRHSNYTTVPQNTNKPSANDEQRNTKPKELPALAGEFQGRDAVHQGSGQARTAETADGPVLQFENFSVTPGPDLFVYLSPNGPDEDLGEFVSLDRLKSNSGAQTYNLPENYRDYRTVVIWCRSFSVTFATAELKPLQ